MSDVSKNELRERVARAWSHAFDDMPPEFQTALLERADAVLSELGLTQAEPVGEVNARGGIRWYSRNLPRTGTALYSAPQPQAAQCVCGEPSLAGVHRADGPCYVPEVKP